MQHGPVLARCVIYTLGTLSHRCSSAATQQVFPLFVSSSSGALPPCVAHFASEATAGRVLDRGSGMTKVTVHHVDALRAHCCAGTEFQQTFYKYSKPQLLLSVVRHDEAAIWREAVTPRPAAAGGGELCVLWSGSMLQSE